jgi:hypothetical protein
MRRELCFGGMAFNNPGFSLISMRLLNARRQAMMFGSRGTTHSENQYTHGDREAQ